MITKLKQIRWWIAAAVGMVLLGLAFAGWSLLMDQRRQMYLRNGREALARSDTEDALFFAGKAVKADPAGIEAWRLMADAMAAAKSPESVFCRARIAMLDPKKIENYLAWAQAALDIGRGDWAAEALARAPQEAENRGDWQNLMGGAQGYLRQFGEAEQHFERAVKLEPANSVYTVNLASLRLNSPDSAIVNRARQELDQLSLSQSVGRFALEALARKALNSGDLENARTYSSKLEGRPDQSWDDRLLELETAFQPNFRNSAADPAALQGNFAQTAAFRDRLADLQQRSASVLGNRIALVYWMIGHGLAKEVTEWLDKEEGSGNAVATQKSMPVPLQMAVADAYRAQQNWERLRRLLEPADWAANDFLRKGLLALCARNEPAFQDRWQEAARSVQGDPEKKFRLGQLVSSWGWYDEASELLWGVTDNSPMWRSSALGQLWQNSFLEKNAGAMLKVATARYRDSPEDAGVKNDYAYLLLLLDLDENRAQELAKEAWTEAPLQPDITATYAFASYKEGRMEEGIKAMEQLADRYRNEPGIALYYAALLSQAGRGEEAARYLARSDGSPRLLPEEQALVAKIKSKIGEH